MFVGLEGLDQFDSVVNGWFNEVESSAQNAAVGLAYEAATRLTAESPQYSGDFASAWVIGVGNVNTRFIPINGIRVDTNDWLPEGESPKKRGDPEAIEYAMSHAASALQMAKSATFGTPIYISNSSLHDEFYAWKIEDGVIDFRPENANADRVTQRAALWVRNRYKHITQSQFEFLKGIV